MLLHKLLVTLVKVRQTVRTIVSDDNSSGSLELSPKNLSFLL